MALKSLLSRAFAATTACAALCMASHAQAQCTGYIVSSASGAGQFISGVDDSGNHCDDCTTAISLPFTFNFYGTDYSSANASSNGSLQFVSNSGAYANNCLPSATFAGPTICPLWDDNYTSGTAAGQGIFTTTVGSAPNRKFVIEWRTQFCCSTAAPNNDFEVVLHEGSSSFEIIYAALRTDSAGATIGCQAGGNPTDAFTQFVCNTAGPAANTTLSFVCNSAVGACCNPNLTCTVVLLANCVTPSIGQAPSSTCSGAGAGCPTSVGRCCNGTTGVCTFVAGAASCPNGSYTNNATCTAACPATGVCCNAITGGCTQIFGGTCPSGTTAGAGTTCSPTPCSSLPSICEGFENGFPNGWTSMVVTGAGADWAVSSSNAHTGVNSISTNDIATVSEQDLTFAPVTAGGNLILDLWSSFDTEPTFDGWVVEYSTDGGGTWTDVGVAGWILNGYNQAAISTTFQSPIAGQPAFSGVFTTWTEHACTIPASVGQQVTIRVRMCSDNSIAHVGVNLDDICIYNIQVGSGACCATNGSCTIQSNTVCTGLFRGVGVACGAGGTCPGDVGKCCNNATGACSLVPGSAACGNNATYGGQGTSCSTACVSVSTCCDNAAGTCTAIFGGSCPAGQSAGSGSSCGPNSCPSISTCCNPTTAACTAIFGGSCPTGLDVGSGTSCGPNSCQYGACCSGCAGCQITAANACTGTYGGNSSTCASACPNDGYTFSTNPAGVTYIAATDDIGLYQDDAFQAISLPFNVSFYGVSYSSANVITNGNLQFTSNGTTFGNVCLPAAALPGPAICPFWDDLYTVGGGGGGNGSGIFTSLTGVSPNQQFVIEWRGVYCCTAGAPTQDFEVIFYEGQNFFDFVYGTPMADRVSATIGVQANGAAGSPFTQFECNSTGPNSGDSIRFSCGVSATNGACCNNTTGGCTSTNAANCPAGSTFQGLGTSCGPNPCPQPPSGVCCRGSTCTTTITTAAACSASLIPGGTAGAVLATGAACNTPGNTTNPCCYANYNKLNGITVQDIFDFLQDWFASSPYANTGGTGGPGPLAVQNIFDFLTAWFNGGC